MVWQLSGMWTDSLQVDFVRGHNAVHAPGGFCFGLLFTLLHGVPFFAHKSHEHLNYSGMIEAGTGGWVPNTHALFSVARTMFARTQST